MGGKAPYESRKIRLIIWLMCGVVLAACGGGPATVQNAPPTGQDPPPTNPPPTNPPPTNPPPTNPSTSGLDARVSNTTCLAPNEPVVSTSVALTRAFPNLGFTSPVLMLQAPGDDTKWYVVEQRGVVSTFANVDSTSTSTEFINVDGRVNSASSEAGLLGMAFDPNFASTGRVYLSYTADAGGGGGVLQSRISRFTMSGGVLNAGSEEVLLTIQQPFTNHNGGNIAFGPDGFLYIGFGDGGGGGDPHGNGQTAQTRCSARCCASTSTRQRAPTRFPRDNPFVGAGPRAATSAAPAAATTARRSTRTAFAIRGAGASIAATRRALGRRRRAGHVRRGRPRRARRQLRLELREGAHCYNAASCATTANGAPLSIPSPNTTTRSAFRSPAATSIAARRSAHLPGAMCLRISARAASCVLTPDNSGKLHRSELLHPSVSVSSFGQGNDGELYVVDYSGTLNKIVPGSGSGAARSRRSSRRPAASIRPTRRNPSAAAHSVCAECPVLVGWREQAALARGCRTARRIDVNGTSGDFDFPNGSVLVKNFTLGNSLIETRLFMRYADTGNWAGYTYRWNARIPDATLVTGGLVASISGQDWVYPSEAQCLQCHTAAAGRSLGLEVQQLNSNFTYSSTGRTANQLDTLQTIGAFTAAPAKVTAMPDPADATQAVADRARAYLHTNCAQCHRPSGGTPVSLDLRYTTAIASTNTCNVAPASGDLGVSGARVIAPGDSTHSVLYLRMSRRDANQMPPVASHKVDTDGAALLQQWINGMNGTCQ